MTTKKIAIDKATPISDISLRDYFAGEALSTRQQIDFDSDRGIAQQLAENAYALADAMMNERKL